MYLYFKNFHTKNGDIMETILYTGARSGISAYVINKLLKKDYLIYVTVHTKKEEEYVRNRYKNESKIKCFKLDITNKEDIEKIKLLNIDVLVCNAAICEGGSLIEMDINRIRTNFEVNVFSNLNLVQIVLQDMIKKDHGKIIIMSSLSSTIPIPFIGAYAGTKASLSLMTRILKKEIKLLTKNVNIVLVEPGMYFTGFNEVMLENKYKYMDIDTFFNEQINIIRKKEKLFFTIFEKKKLNSIGNKIYLAITSNNPNFIYRAPLTHSIAAKIYKFLT